MVAHPDESPSHARKRANLGVANLLLGAELDVEIPALAELTAATAALAIGSWPGLSQDQLKAKAQQFFDANYSAADLGSVGKINVGFSGGDIKIKHEPPLNSIEWKPSWPTVWRTQRRTARPTARITDAPSGIAASRGCPPKA